MNDRFTAALERAFEFGLESRASAAGQIAFKRSIRPRFVMPLCPIVRDGLLRSAAGGEIVFLARS
jgi:hypothetical protein